MKPTPDAAARLVQRRWFRRQSKRHTAALTFLRQMSECAICGDECVDMVRCANGHGCCTGCDASKDGRTCPLCREPQIQVIDGLVPMVMRNCALRLRCVQCGVCVPSEERERHRAWCPAYTFACPIAGCTHACRASTMARHVHMHRGEHVHTVERDGRITLVVSRFVEDVVLLLSDGERGNHKETAVVLSFGRRSVGAADMLLGQMTLCMRAYYTDCDAPAWHASVRQMRVQDCLAGTWMEEHRVGIVPPAIAARETLVLSNYAPIISPRCILCHESGGGSVRVCNVVSNGRDVAKSLRQIGVRDVPLVTKPYMQPDLAGIPVAILQFHFVRDTSVAIGDVYRD